MLVTKNLLVTLYVKSYLVSKSVTAEDLQSLMSGWFSWKLKVLGSQVQRAKPVAFEGQG